MLNAVQTMFVSIMNENYTFMKKYYKDSRIDLVWSIKFDESRSFLNVFLFRG